MFSIPKIPKNPQIYFCESCNYKTSNKKDYRKHLKTIKHKINENQWLAIENVPEIPKYECVCGRHYKDNSGLWRHKKKCFETKAVIITEDITTKREYDDITEFEGLDDKGLILKLLEQNKDLQKALIELSKEKTVTNSNIHSNNNNTNSNNKTFNLQFFLNETCKNAMNISDFVSSIKPQLSDLETTGQLGYVEGISNIILSNLRLLKIHDRPLHCSDFKREVIYIKDNDQWTKENEDKPILTKAIKIIANENIKNINEWRKEYPDCIQSDSRKNDTYLKIVSNSMSGSTKEETNKNLHKIITNIAKEVVIDKKI